MPTSDQLQSYFYCSYLYSLHNTTMINQEMTSRKDQNRQCFICRHKSYDQRSQCHPLQPKINHQSLTYSTRVIYTEQMINFFFSGMI